MSNRAGDVVVVAHETVLARMFAGFEAMLTPGVAAGGVLAPLVIELLGVRLAPLAIALIAPLAVAASWPELCRLDVRMRVRDADIEILRGVPMLGALPATTIEQLGAGLEHAGFAPRQAVFEQGERGERFLHFDRFRTAIVIFRHQAEAGLGRLVQPGRVQRRSSSKEEVGRWNWSSVLVGRPWLALD